MLPLRFPPPLAPAPASAGGDDTRTAAATVSARRLPAVQVGWWKFRRVEAGTEPVYALGPGELRRPSQETPLSFAGARRPEIFVGRESACEFALGLPSPEREVSRRHARIFAAGDNSIRIEDLGSKNGTIVTTDTPAFPPFKNLSMGDSAELGAGTLVRLARDWLGEVVPAPAEGEGSPTTCVATSRYRVAELGAVLRPWRGMVECKLVQAVCRAHWFEDCSLRERVLSAAMARCRELSLTVLRLEHIAAPAGQGLPSFESDDRGGWRVHFEGRVLGPLRLRGIWFVAVSVGDPGRIFDVVDLVNAYDGGGAETPRCHGGEQLDRKALQEYRERLVEVHEELDRAGRENDLARKEKLEAERHWLMGILESAVGLGGRSRKMNDPRERARSRVKHAIDRAVDALERLDAGLGQRLRRSLETGYTLSFDSRRFLGE
jgi:hypothetical protein